MDSGLTKPSCLCTEPSCHHFVNSTLKYWEELEIQDGVQNHLEKLIESFCCNFPSLDVEWIQEFLLHLFCERKSINFAKCLLEKFPQLINMRCGKGFTCLHHAAEGGSIDILSFLIEKGCNPNLRTNDGKTVLHIACGLKNDSMIRFLVQHKSTDIDAKTENGWNPGHISANMGDLDGLLILKRAGLDVSAVTAAGETILNIACKNGNVELVTFLVNEFPDLLQLKDEKGYNALHAACLGENIEIFDLLVSCGVAIALTNENDTILHIAAGGSSHDLFSKITNEYPQLLRKENKEGLRPVHVACLNGKLHFLKEIIDDYIKTIRFTKRTFQCRIETEIGILNFPIVYNASMTVLHTAVTKSKVDIISFVLSKCPSYLEIRSPNGDLPLHTAARCDNMAALGIFGRYNEKYVASLTISGETVMHIAALESSIAIVQFLIENHSELLSITSYDGSLPCHHACLRGNTEVIDMLMCCGADFLQYNKRGESALHVYTQCKRFDIQTFLRICDNSKVNLDHRTKDGSTFLHMACKAKNFELMEFLVEKYPSIVVVMNETGLTAFHHGIENGCLKSLKILMKNQRYQYPNSIEENSYLHTALYYDSELSICEYLASKFPRMLNIPNAKGLTPCHLAASKKRSIPLLQVFEFYGGNFDVRSKRQENVLHIACASSDFDVIEYIIKRYAHLVLERNFQQCTPLDIYREKTHPNRDSVVAINTPNENRDYCADHDDSTDADHDDSTDADHDDDNDGDHDGDNTDDYHDGDSDSDHVDYRDSDHGDDRDGGHDNDTDGDHDHDQDHENAADLILMMKDMQIDEEKIFNIVTIISKIKSLEDLFSPEFFSHASETVFDVFPFLLRFLTKESMNYPDDEGNLPNTSERDPDEVNAVQSESPLRQSNSTDSAAKKTMQSENDSTLFDFMIQKTFFAEENQDFYVSVTTIGLCLLLFSCIIFIFYNGECLLLTIFGILLMSISFICIISPVTSYCYKILIHKIELYKFVYKLRMMKPGNDLDVTFSSNL